MRKKGDEYEILKNASIYIEDGIIKEIYCGQQSYPSRDNTAKIFDARSMVATPGFIDCHTHLVFSGSREGEFEMRAMGKTYEEIMKGGGGISNSVRTTREVSEEELYEISFKRLNNILAYGVTTCEIKSGYGLSLDSEIKILSVINQLKKNHAVDIIPTFLGAHDIPIEYKNNREKYIDIIMNEMLPEIMDRRLATFCDIFCEDGVFTINESRMILSRARDLGYKVKIHADEFCDTGGAALAAELSAISADHLLFSNEENLLKMKEANVAAVLLPGVSLSLNKRFVNARRLIDIGLNVAVASDFNPGSSMSSFLPLMASLACMNMGLRPIESIAAITINGALALGIENDVGSIEEGKMADILFFDIPNYKFIPYNYGENHLECVIKSGKVIYERKS